MIGAVVERAKRAARAGCDRVDEFFERLEEADEEYEDDDECPSCADAEQARVEAETAAEDLRSRVAELEGITNADRRDGEKLARQVNDLIAERNELQSQLYGMQNRDETIAAVLEILKTFRARADQQLGEIEAMTRDWDRRNAELVRAARASVDYSKELEAFIEKLRAVGKPKKKS